MKKCISAGASLLGAIWNSNSTPSIVRLSPGAIMRSVGRSSATAPAAMVLPSPQSTCPRTPFASNGPNWYIARRSIAGPAMMFSETACSMNRLGAMIGTLPPASTSSSSTPRAPAPMVGMGVGKDHGGDRTLAAVLEIKLHRGPRALDRGQRVHHDHAAVALDQRHVGDVEPAHLIDAGYDFEQAVMHVEPRLPPQAGVNRRRRLFGGEEAVGLQTPDHPALRRRDLRVLHGAEEAARGVVEIPDVGERQRLQRRRVLRDDGSGCLLRRFLRGFHRGWLAHCSVLPCANNNW